MISQQRGSPVAPSARTSESARSKAAVGTSPAAALMSPSSQEPSDLVAAEIIVSGMVQGVGYRFFTQRAAEELKLCGWVRNLPDGRVQAEVEGPREQVDEFVSRLRVGPRLSSVTAVAVTWKAAGAIARGFVVKP